LLPIVAFTKGDSIHLYTITNSRTSVLSIQIQEFGKAGRPGKRELTKITNTYVGKEGKSNVRYILSINCCYNEYL